MRVNIYVRNEDQAKWDAIADKPGWLHSKLNGEEAQHDINKAIEQIKQTPIDYSKPLPKQSEPKFCQHGAAVGFCKFGCKK